MRNLLLICTGLATLTTDFVAHAMFNDDPLLSKVMAEFELFEEAGETALEWDVDIWIGRDLNKVWIKTAGERVGSEFEDANIEIVNSRAISAYWDHQFGLRQDLGAESNSGKNRTWVSYGFIGTAPYFVEVDARLFVGEESSSQILIELEREIMLTQEWVLTPELDIVANGRSNRQYNEGSGLAEIEFSLRLGYEHEGNRKFQPFLGVSAVQKIGATRSLAKADDRESSDFKLIVGVHGWY